jgi:hypothetical protein
LHFNREKLAGFERLESRDAIRQIATRKPLSVSRHPPSAGDRYGRMAARCGNGSAAHLDVPLHITLAQVPAISQRDSRYFIYCFSAVALDVLPCGFTKSFGFITDISSIRKISVRVPDSFSRLGLKERQRLETVN